VPGQQRRSSRPNPKFSLTRGPTTDKERPTGCYANTFPKRTDLSVHILADLLAVEERLNHRPRKVLGWQTPAQIFHAAVTR
jgi:IS30 family transposase